jgi:hypothetical protein
MTPFCFEHVFRASSTAEVFAAYFDAGHQLEQDRRVDIVERTVLELSQTDDELRRTSRVVPRRQLPGFVRPLVSGQLSYVETILWRKHADEIDIEIRPSILRGRASITALYRLSRGPTGSILRRYEGFARIEVSLIGPRIERGIVAEFGRTLPVAAACTQAWLDRPQRSVSARA